MFICQGTEMKAIMTYIYYLLNFPWFNDMQSWLKFISQGIVNLFCLNKSYNDIMHLLNFYMVYNDTTLIEIYKLINICYLLFY